MSNTNKADVIRKKWHPAGWMPAGFRQMWEYAVALELLLNAAECHIEDLKAQAEAASSPLTWSREKPKVDLKELRIDLQSLELVIEAQKNEVFIPFNPSTMRGYLGYMRSLQALLDPEPTPPEGGSQ